MKLRIGDIVIVTAGRDKGLTGPVLKIDELRNRVTVDGVNQKTKHIKASQGKPGERVVFNSSLDVSNVAVVDPKTGEATRIAYKKENGIKVRVSKKTGLEITKKTAAKASKKVAAKESTTIKA